MKNKVILVTGALTGIGRATALAFAREGAHIAVSGRHNEAGNALATEVKDGVLVEHWDVIQNEATREQSKSGKPMFGDTFPV